MTTQPTVLGRLLCFIGEHRFYIIGRCGPGSHHVGCRRCSRQWGMNHPTRSFLPWDAELADFHRDTFGYRASQEQPHG